MRACCAFCRCYGCVSIGDIIRRVILAPAILGLRVHCGNHAATFGEAAGVAGVYLC